MMSFRRPGVGQLDVAILVAVALCRRLGLLVLTLLNIGQHITIGFALQQRLTKDAAGLFIIAGMQTFVLANVSSAVFRTYRRRLCGANTKPS